ncbi:YdcF family protein [Aerococcaceae bacterium DSM 111020]|nr:YdcF family protein [Aerococcaceae bacterium DSM 111020]
MYFKKTDFPIDFPKETDIDLIILYGKQINHDRTLSKELDSRMMKALQAANCYSNADIITLSGAVHNQYFEGEVLHNWLIDHGVQVQRILLDLTGLDVVSETLAVVEVIAHEKFQNILILSSPNDLPRHFLSLKAAIHSHQLEGISIFPMNHLKEWRVKIPILEQTKSWQSTLRSAGIFTAEFYKPENI